MKRAFRLRPELSHEAASLIAQLVLRTTLPAEHIEEVRALLLRHAPARILAALEQARTELTAAAGQGPDFPDAQAYTTLAAGLRALDEVDHTYQQAA